VALEMGGDRSGSASALGAPSKSLGAGLRRRAARMAVAAFVVGGAALVALVRAANERHGLPGGWVCLAVGGVLPFLGPLIVLKELLVPLQLEAAVARRVVPYLAPRSAFDGGLPAPDYGSEEAWAALPWRLDTADGTPPRCGERECEADRQHPGAGGGAGAESAGLADVFYVSPTAFYDSYRWNVMYNDTAFEYLHDEALIPQQAMPFNAAGRIFSPRIRQMTGFGYFAEDAAARERAISLAYGDVRRAFVHFYKHWNAGRRPLVLAAHSQGSEHLTRLLSELFAEGEGGACNEGLCAAELRGHLVAAYLPGMPVYLDKLSRWGLRACQGALDVGCVISWQSYRAGHDPLAFHIQPALTALRTPEPDGANQLCTNPLSWRSGDGEYMDRSRNLGGMHIIQWWQNVAFLFWGRGPETPDKATRQRERINGLLLPLAPRLTGAQCRNGSLYVDELPFSEVGDGIPWLHAVFPIWRVASFPGSLHPYDLNLCESGESSVHRVFVVS
jgi:hypothetical protein